MPAVVPPCGVSVQMANGGCTLANERLKSAAAAAVSPLSRWPTACIAHVIAGPLGSVTCS